MAKIYDSRPDFCEIQDFQAKKLFSFLKFAKKEPDLAGKQEKQENKRSADFQMKPRKIIEK